MDEKKFTITDLDKKDWASVFEVPKEHYAASADREMFAYVEPWEQPTKKSTLALHNLRLKYGLVVLLDEVDDDEEDEGADQVPPPVLARQIEQVK